MPLWRSIGSAGHACNLDNAPQWARKMPQVSLTSNRVDCQAGNWVSPRL